MVLPFMPAQTIQATGLAKDLVIHYGIEVMARGARTEPG